MISPALQTIGLCKAFGGERVVDNVSLAVAESEYLCLLGASGSGKTTFLRLIAGLETSSSGKIALFGNDITRTKPHERGIPLVFQQPSLWPHMKVLDQIAFGLKERGTDSKAAYALASSYIERVGLSGLQNRKPGQLSGGQQQRVALARCLVLGAKVILLDEPLANLDASLKSGMRDLLRRLPVEFGVTVIHVTHDREDAFELADRVAILDKGAIAAYGTPGELYRNPPSASAASLLGETNCLEGEVVSIDSDVAVVRTGFGLWRASHCPAGLALESRVKLLFRPESIDPAVSDSLPPEQYNCISAEANARHFAGPLIIYKLRATTADSAQTLLLTRFAFEKAEQPGLANGRVKYHVSPAEVILTVDAQPHSQEEGLP